MDGLPMILVVDDEPSGREVIEGLLHDQGYNVAFATNGVEALSRAAAFRPDLVLLDVMMPGMDGFEVCRRLRADSRLAQVPIVMITSLDDRESKLRAIEVGADDFISKPIDRVELRARIRTITRLDRFRRLHSERAKFEWAVEQSEDGYLVLSPDDDILYANPKARQFLGLAPGRNAVSSEKFLAVARRQYQLSPGGVQVERTRFAGGGQRSISFLVQPETDRHEAMWLRVDRLKMTGGEEAAVLVRLSNATNRVLLQRDSWTFNALVRHKLRTPLTSVYGAIECLHEELVELGDKDLSELAEVAYRGAIRLKTDVAKIFEHMESISASECSGTLCPLADLRSIAEAAAEIVGIDRSRLLVTGLEDLGGVRIALSSQSMEIILLALFENSLKFHPTRSPNVAVRVALEAEHARIAVTDDGVSLSAEQIEQIFVPYFQAERFFTGQVPGMGLGLPTVAALVSRVGGAAHVQNRIGVPGVMVEFTSPLETTPEERRVTVTA